MCIRDRVRSVQERRVGDVAALEVDAAAELAVLDGDRGLGPQDTAGGDHGLRAAESGSGVEHHGVARDAVDVDVVVDVEAAGVGDNDAFGEKVRDRGMAAWQKGHVGVLTTSSAPDEGSVSPGSAHDQEAGPDGGCCQRGVFELPLRDAVDRRPPGCGADQNSGHGQRSDREDLRREQAEGRRERHLADVDDPEVVATIDDEAAKRWTGGRGRYLSLIHI